MNSSKRSPKTLKQKAWTKAYLTTGNATEAAMTTYDCVDRASASVIGHKNLTKLNFSDLLTEIGLGDADLALGLKSATEAKRLLVTSEALYWVADWPTKIRAIELALKLKGKFPKPGSGEVGRAQQWIDDLKLQLGIDEESLEKAAKEGVLETTSE